MAWTPGTQLHNNKYKIIKELGQGNFGITYLALQQDGKNIVIKTLNQNLLNQLSQDERNKIETDFADEARKLEKCQHPHIVSVIEIFKQDESWCIALEYIPGDTLACFTKRMLPEKEAIGYIRQIGEALKEVHHQGLLHRDVKPENIMVRASKYEAVLIDFGLAREIESIDNFPCTDLRTIDQLWVKYSNGRFGFSVQKRIWESVGGNPDADYETWCKFGDRVGWRVNLEWLEWLNNQNLHSAEEGHLPYIGSWRVGGMLRWFRVFFSRLQTCKL